MTDTIDRAEAAKGMQWAVGWTVNGKRWPIAMFRGEEFATSVTRHLYYGEFWKINPDVGVSSSLAPVWTPGMRFVLLEWGITHLALVVAVWGNRP